METLRNLIKKVEDDRLVSNRDPKPRKDGEPVILNTGIEKRGGPSATIDSQGSDSHGFGLIDRL